MIQHQSDNYAPDQNHNFLSIPVSHEPSGYSIPRNKEEEQIQFHQNGHVISTISKESEATASHKDIKTEIMKRISKEVKTIVYRIPNILFFSFESYFLGYKYHEMVDVFKSGIAVVESGDGIVGKIFRSKNKRK